MRLAVLYLLDSDMTVNDIGIKLGYDYQSHFCTAFKRKYGVSPIEYRAMQHPQVQSHRNRRHHADAYEEGGSRGVLQSGEQSS